MLKQGSALDRYFKVSERGSNFSREIRGGFATFFAMSYIVVLNPLILSGPSIPSPWPPGSASTRSSQSLWPRTPDCPGRT
jgi:hypothetical protein